MDSVFSGAVVTITGGTGSFGNALTSYLLSRDVGEVRILSRDESKQDNMRQSYNDSRLKFILGDVRELETVDQAVRGANKVFHAAALKQVPATEHFPIEAVKTNVLGSANVLNSSVTHSVETVVCLSTDKAVYPVNAMGMSKALMEKTAQALARKSDGKTKIAITRYGNVMYSRGSVIPVFISQIKSGKKLSITNPHMSRFMMSLADSVGLVEYAMQKGASGDVFVRKAPSATVGDLASALLNLFNRDPSDVELIGVRHGEKLFESLLSSEEATVTEDHGEFYRISIDQHVSHISSPKNLNYTAKEPAQPFTSENTERLTIAGIQKLLLQVPEVRRDLDLPV